jgi:hypothetical protein
MTQQLMAAPTAVPAAVVVVRPLAAVVVVRPLAAVVVLAGYQVVESQG